MKSPTVGRLLVVSLLVSLVGVVQGAGAQTAAVAPRTLLKANCAIQAFAQSSDAVAWADRCVSSLDKIHVAGISSGRRWVVSGDIDYSVKTAPALALAGTRALWTSTWFGTRQYFDVMVGTPTDRRPSGTLLTELSQESEFGNDSYFGGMAGDGTTLVYGWTHVSPVSDPPNFDRVVDGGGVVLVGPPPASPRPPSTIPHVPGPAPFFSRPDRADARPTTLALSEGRIAVVPPAAVVPGRNWYAAPKPAENGPVGVYDLKGNLLSQARPAGTVREVAMSWPQLGVIVQRSDGSSAIERYDARTGTVLTTTVVPKATANLAMGTGGTVYRVGNLIYRLRAATPSLVRRCKAPPIGLSVVGRRVAWAVNLGGRGRILTLTLPR